MSSTNESLTAHSPASRPQGTRDDFLRMIREDRITPHFQPVVDLYFGDVIGYEVLSRGEGAFTMPAVMFPQAQEWGLSWELECACRTAALRKIATLAPAWRSKCFFLNVTPSIFSDGRFRNGFTTDSIRGYGLEREQIVIEITETTSSSDYEQFEDIVRHYVDLGFQIALDDFGAGHSGLVTLLNVLPHYLKLDRALVSGIHLSAYKQHLLKAVASFAEKVQSHIIAEGVENFEELETCLRLGARYAQGFFLARPAPVPADLPDDLRWRIAKMARRYYYPNASISNSVTALLMRPPTLDAGAVSGETVHYLFDADRSMDHIVLLSQNKPVGLITRQDFYSKMGGPFGYALFQRRPVDQISKKNALTVNQAVEVTFLGRLAMTRDSGSLYDPAIVIDDAGCFRGTVTMKQILQRTMDLELERASNSNPLTHLPGNHPISTWLTEATAKPTFAVLYADLDHFKEYDDVYGFPRGDEMIKFLASLLEEALPRLTRAGRLGHIGGDDFVMVAEGLADLQELAALCRAFDERKLRFFRGADLARGGYVSTDRTGQNVETPLVTLSLACVTERNVPPGAHPALVGQTAAAIKKRVKTINAERKCSNYLVDQRLWVA